LGFGRNSGRGLWLNTIEACKRAEAKLIFFDNVYMYGKVVGPMMENTPYAPCSKKGEIRAKIAIALMNEVQAGGLSAMIARSADFYGPDTQNGVPNVLVFEPFAKGAKASWLVNAAVPHSLTFTPDAARGVAMLADQESTRCGICRRHPIRQPAESSSLWLQVNSEWPPKYRVLSRPMLRLAGWFNPQVRESYEMLYQSDSPYLFDSTKFANEFGFAGTSYPDGVRIAADSYKGRQRPAKSGWRK
jgi:nucleoside-diphosphate-sugar epimerase